MDLFAAERHSFTTDALSGIDEDVGLLLGELGATVVGTPTWSCCRVIVSGLKGP